MRIYRKTFRISEHFPVAIDEEWSVKQGNKVVEHWRVTHKTPLTFTAEITEYQRV